MSNEKEIAILETALLLLTGTKEFDILKLDLAPYLIKAKEVLKIVKS